MPLQSREEFDAAIAKATAADDAPAVEELTRRRNTRFPVSEGGASPTAAPPPDGRPRQRPWDMTDEMADQFTMGLAPAVYEGTMGLVDAVGNVIGGGQFNPGEQYESRRKGRVAAQELYRTEHPNAAQAARAVGFAGNIGTAANVANRVLPSALTGGGIGGVEGFIAEPGGEGGIVERLIGAAKGAGVGAAIGAAGPYVGQAAGWTWNTVRRALQEGTGIAQRSVEKIVAELQHQGMTPQQAGQAAQRLGPEGMLADVNPGMQQMTAATGAVEPGAATTITRALRDRRVAAPERTRQYLDRAMGPAQDPYTVREASTAARGQISLEYTAAIANAPRLPASLDDLVAEGLTFPMANMSLSSRQFMGTIFDEVDDALRAGDPSMTAARLLNIRQNLDKQIVYDPRSVQTLSSADKANQGALTEARAVIDDILKNRIPGIREADEQFAPIARQQEAFEQGRTDVMKAGPSTMTEAELRAIYQRSTPEVNRMRTQGMRAELERQTRNERQNAALTVDRTLNRDFNAEKLGVQIGPSRANRLANELDREGTFLETSNMAEAGRGSRTAPLTETARRVWGTGGDTGLIGDMAVAGATGFGTTGSLSVGAATAGAAGARRLVSGAADRLSRPASEVILRTAENLTLSGSRRTALVQALIDEAAQIPIREQSRQRVEQLARALLMSSTAPAGEAASRFGH